MPFTRITTPSETLLWLRLNRRQRRHRAEARERPDLAAFFGDVQRCCLFIGHPRSGHSLIGSLIDAHPNAIVAHRLDMLKHMDNGASRAELFFMAMRNSEEFARSGRSLTGYAYALPEQWQGRFESLQLIGDQEGEKTAQRLHRDPDLLARAMTVFGGALNFVHVVRNPFDNITTIALRAYRGLDYAIARYLTLCEAIDDVRHRVGEDCLLQIRYESLVDDLMPNLSRMFGFLGLAAQDGFLSDCSKIVYPTAHRSRFRMPWSESQKRSVLAASERYAFLRGYGFDDA